MRFFLQRGDARRAFKLKKSVTFLIPFAFACLVTACANLGLKQESRAYGAKFTGNHAALARCVVDKLQSDSRWIIRSLQYKVLTYRDIEATEVYAYTQGALPGTYARNSPSNPDAVISYGPPMPEVHARKPASTSQDDNSDYSFVLTLKRTDNATVFATLNGKKYEAGIAWDKLKACSTP